MTALVLARYDSTVTDAMGAPLSGVQVFVCLQPANTTSVPPSPLAQVYTDEAGQNPIDQVTPGGITFAAGVSTYNQSQQLVTDQDGYFDFYVAPGVYTLVFYSPRIAGLTLVLPDQSVNGLAPLPPQYNNDSSTAGTITPLPDGVDRAFDLSGIPSPAASLIFCVNGVVQIGWTIVYATVSLPTAPLVGDVITAVYQVQG